MKETRRVRIAVLLDEGGDWVAYGSQGASDEDVANECYGFGVDFDGEAHVVFVEADVPSPKPLTVEGEPTP